MAIKDIIKKAKNKVVDVASDIMSAPARIKSQMSVDKANSQIADLKMVRDMKHMEDSGNWKDPLFRARANVSNMKFEREYAAKRAAANK